MKWSKGIILLFLGLLIKVSVAEKSTQVYLFELEADSSIYENIKKHLEGFNSSGNASLSTVTITTNCIESSDGKKKNCACQDGYTWSSDICKNYKCCNNDNCILNNVDAAVCLSDKRVSINGSTIMTRYSYQEFFEINNDKTELYQNKIKSISDELITSFSRLPCFYSLVITGVRKGSVIVDYVVQLLGPLDNITQLQIIADTLNGSTIVTQGLVTLRVIQDQPIAFNSIATINCETQQDLGSVKWLLTDAQNKTKEITNGTEASLTKANYLTDSLNLINISGIWKGTFQCQYTTNSILHTAIGQLDIALLPEIRGISYPQFPDCRNTNEKTKVIIECAIPISTENYNVTWEIDELIAASMQPEEIKGSFISHTLEAMVDCRKEKVTVSCTFTNNRVQTNLSREKTVEVFIITKTSKVCEADNDWPVAKQNYTAIKYCEGFSVGERQRECKETWKDEISKCVNQDLHSIQTNVKELEKGIGILENEAHKIFNNLHKTTTTNDFTSFANINASVNIFDVMNKVSQQQQHQWNDSVMSDIVKSASNLLNETKPWQDPNYDTNLSINYLLSFENTMLNSNLSESFCAKHIQLTYYNTSNPDCKISNANANVTSNHTIIAAEFSNLAQILPIPFENKSNSSDAPILSVTIVNNSNNIDGFEANLMFSYADRRLPNHKMFCVFWDATQNNWSESGCSWGGTRNPNLCTCNHNTSFTMLMSKSPESLPYMDELTYVGLGISIVSLVLCLLIEVLVWNTVVKSNVSNFRHIALVNISICLLLAYIGFLASVKPTAILSNWCVILTFVKHFCFLSVFFWMLCLSFVLLHQIIFVFEQLRKKVYLVLSITVGYVCPLLCAAATYISFGNGKEGEYYLKETCWLTYKGPFKGSMFAFVIPVGTIVFINMFTLFVVITKLVTPTVSDAKAMDEKDVAKSIIKTIVFLCPVLGITWIFGLFVLMVDLTDYPLAYIVNYAFTVLNSLQGFFILLTNCIGEKKIRDALLKRFKGQKSVHSKSESSTKAGSSVLKEY
ncbi:adhesion G protein-coupled receptor F5-like [Xyrauchen texanus]|uniref:adhesion G protein-coupled receptor F5-like n=1 Tax=Xyrauchen texanus TaxID=154827 RepID=UPI0022423C49|nr:adhesion G protein-coupled receptor F5-like [Xyrauchen texanus]